MISLAGGQPNPGLFPITGLSFTANGQNHTLSSKMVAKGLQVIFFIILVTCSGSPQAAGH